MPVDLTLLPEKLPTIKKFNIWFWIILLIVFIIIGGLFTLVFSFIYSISSSLFVILGLVFPAVLWVFSFLYGIYYRGYKETYIKNWNLQRDIREQQLIDYARRGLYVINYSLITEYGQGNNANGIATHQHLLVTKRSPNVTNLIPYSSLPLPLNVSSDMFYERLKTIFTDWQRDNEKQLKHLSGHFMIHVRLFIDVLIMPQQIEKLWLETLSNTIKSKTFSIEDANSSSQFIEQWLDNSDYDKDLLLIINAHLFSSPTKNEAESALFILFAGEQAFNHMELPLTKADVIKVYRSEQTDNWRKTIDNALLWASINNKAYDGMWYSDLSTEQYINVMTYFNQIEFNNGSAFNIDTSIGNIKKSAYFLALALAIEHAIKTKNNQLIVIGQPKMTVSVVTSVTKELTEK